MSTKLMWRGLIGLVILMSAGGCSTMLDSNAGNSYADAGANGPFLSFHTGDTEFKRTADKPLSVAYKKGITLRDLLRNSGIVVFAEDGKSILSVSDVTLDPQMKWELQVGEELLGYEDWDHAVDRTDHIILIASPKENVKSVESVVLFVNGANDHPEMTHSYVLPFIADSSVRSLLKNSGLVLLSENKKNILTVNDYSPLTDEVWRIKVNGKLLMENGMDMKLHPQDEVEIVLTLR